MSDPANPIQAPANPPTLAPMPETHQKEVDMTQHNIRPSAESGVRDTGSGLAAAASLPNIDPCDIAEAAMPALLARDLTSGDIAWITDHTGDCHSCAENLRTYERLDDTLDRLSDAFMSETAPPAFVPPIQPERTTRRRALKATARSIVATYQHVDSPVGPLLVAVSASGVCEISYMTNTSEAAFLAQLHERGFAPIPNDPTTFQPASAIGRNLTGALAQLDEYFAGQRNGFDVPVDYTGMTPFTTSVLTATAGVPFGQLTTYAGIAAQIGQPGASRAVGNALGRNPVPVIVPCHRIVRSDHRLGGYTGGVRIKERLLAIEGALMQISSG